VRLIVTSCCVLAGLSLLVAALPRAAVAQSGETLSVQLPSAAAVIEAFAVALIAELMRRGLKKLDAVARKCDQIETALLGIDGRGGIVDDVRDLQGAVYHDSPVAPPPGYSPVRRPTDAPRTA
jgi:hypothetical protein